VSNISREKKEKNTDMQIHVSKKKIESRARDMLAFASLFAYFLMVPYETVSLY
jgi:hypothetical protein